MHRISSEPKGSGGSHMKIEQQVFGLKGGSMEPCNFDAHEMAEGHDMPEAGKYLRHTKSEDAE